MSEMLTEEFEVPGGKIVVDAVRAVDRQDDNGINIAFYDESADTADLSQALLPTKNQWLLVKNQVCDWLMKVLE